MSMLARLQVFNPIEERIPAPKSRKRLPHFLPWADAMKLLDWCVAETERAIGWRGQMAKIDETIVRLGLFLGLRSCEFLKLEVKHINIEKRACFIHDSKGGRDRMVCIPDKLVPFLEKLIGERTEGSLILMPKKTDRLNYKHIYNRIVNCGKRAGISVKVHPHLLRHSYATHFLEVGGNIRTLQKMLGHSDLATTAVYLDVDVGRFLTEVNKM